MIHTLIERSLLLSSEQKQALLAAVENLRPEQLEELQSLLMSGDQAVANAAQDIIRSVVEAGDTGALQGMDKVIAAGTTKLSHAQETAESTDEKKDLEHFFDAEQ